MDTVYICITLPKCCKIFYRRKRSSSFWDILQIFLYLTLIGGEFFLLGLMAFGRYLAVCKPLGYPLLMNCRICLSMVVGFWVGSSLDGFMLTPFTMSFPYWLISREINHFFCEIPPVLKMSCLDTSLCETLMYACCVLILLIPISIISISYKCILLTVHWMNSAEGQHKAFAKSSSHILVVRISYGAAFYTNVLPHSYHTPEKDKFVSTFYTILTSMVSPLIYILRNKDVATALIKCWEDDPPLEQWECWICTGNTRGGQIHTSFVL